MFTTPTYGFCFACEDYREINVTSKVEHIHWKTIPLTVKQYSCTCKECGELATADAVEHENDRIILEAVTNLTNQE